MQTPLGTIYDRHDITQDPVEYGPNPDGCTIKINGDETRVTGVNNLRNNNEQTDIRLENGGKIIADNDSPDVTYHPPNGDPEPVAEYVFNMTEVETFSPEFHEDMQAIVGRLVAVDDDGLGDAYERSSFSRPESFKVWKVVDVVNGKAVLSDSDQKKMYPCVERFDGCIRELPRRFYSEIECGQFLHIYPWGVGRSRFHDPILPASVWESETAWETCETCSECWMPTTHGYVPQLTNGEEEQLRSEDGMSDTEMSQFIRRNSDCLDGVQLVVNDWSEPQTVEWAHSKSGRFGSGSSKVHFESGTFMSRGQNGTEFSVHRKESDEGIEDLWYIGVVESDAESLEYLPEDAVHSPDDVERLDERNGVADARRELSVGSESDTDGGEDSSASVQGVNSTVQQGEVSVPSAEETRQVSLDSI